MILQFYLEGDFDMFSWHSRLNFSLFSVCFVRCLRGGSMWRVRAGFGVFVPIFCVLTSYGFISLRVV